MTLYALSLIGIVCLVNSFRYPYWTYTPFLACIGLGCIGWVMYLLPPG